jgi:hypothetical protein
VIIIERSKMHQRRKCIDQGLQFIRGQFLDQLLEILGTRLSALSKQLRSIIRDRDVRDAPVPRILSALDESRALQRSHDGCHRGL